MAVHDPCALLERLLGEARESSWLEFKGNNGDPDTIGEYISALANGAMLSGRDRAFLVFGVDDAGSQPIGTTVRLGDSKKGGENLLNWLGRLLQPRLMIECLDFECEGLHFAIVVIEPSYERPVSFKGVEYVRIGENKRRLSDFPEHERAIWLATGRRRFEDAIALTGQTEHDVLLKLDARVAYTLRDRPQPRNTAEVIRSLVGDRFLNDTMDGRYDVTNLGAILLARDIREFPSIAGRSVRVVQYAGRDKRRSLSETEGRRGYAVGFAGMMRYLLERLPSEERYIDGIRRNVALYPETAVREIVANALIHQDFTVTGSGPIVEIYEDRVEVTNAGDSLIDPDRILDERRSRNEKLASAMRELGLCEERGGGLDKTFLEIEAQHLPAPEFIASENSFRVVLFGPRAFSDLSKADRLRACFYHGVLRWLTHDYMSNASLRERFSLPDKDYQAVSAVISEAIRMGRIAPADPAQGRRNARYVPYWAASG
ncbi:ATP-binding protein [Salinarimonas chemoclinalis]|uniref:ATP-binding protein n=1 Tax=Salinarimonas chemoclinalis TaxID=3241599 RepID=UPI0035589345